MADNTRNITNPITLTPFQAVDEAVVIAYIEAVDNPVIYVNETPAGTVAHSRDWFRLVWFFTNRELCYECGKGWYEHKNTNRDISRYINHNIYTAVLDNIKLVTFTADCSDQENIKLSSDISFDDLCKAFDNGEDIAGLLIFRAVDSHRENLFSSYVNCFRNNLTYIFKFDFTKGDFINNVHGVSYKQAIYTLDYSNLGLSLQMSLFPSISDVDVEPVVTIDSDSSYNPWR